MVTNDRIDELQKWIMESRLSAPAAERTWYSEMADALEELEKYQNTFDPDRWLKENEFRRVKPSTGAGTEATR
jgi:hypothetical protein